MPKMYVEEAALSFNTARADTSIVGRSAEGSLSNMSTVVPGFSISFQQTIIR